MLASFPGLPHFLFFGLRSVKYTEAEELFFAVFDASVDYTERKPKNKKRGRPGNATSNMLWQEIASTNSQIL